jgi:hypothetical protein
MNQQIASTASGNNGESTPHDLFALTDEQILEIEPEAQDTTVARGVYAKDLVRADFFVVPTIAFHVLFVFVILGP